MSTDLVLDGQLAGVLDGATGGMPFGVVDTDGAKKRLTGVKYEPILLRCGTGMSDPVYEWVADLVGGGAPPARSGEVRFLSPNGAGTRLEFTGALLSAVEFPGVGGSSHDAAPLRLTLWPASTRFRAATGMTPQPTSPVAKPLIRSNFRLGIDGLDCTHVATVDALTFTPGQAPDLRVELAMSHAASWFHWHEDFVVKGNNGDANERAGSLAYLSPDFTTELFRLTFHGLGIWRLQPDHAERTVTATLYCERMALDRHP